MPAERARVRNRHNRYVCVRGHLTGADGHKRESRTVKPSAVAKNNRQKLPSARNAARSKHHNGVPTASPAAKPTNCERMRSFFGSPRNRQRKPAVGVHGMQRKAAVARMAFWLPPSKKKPKKLPSAREVAPRKKNNPENLPSAGRSSLRNTRSLVRHEK